MLKYDCKKSIYLVWKATEHGSNTALFGKQLKFAEDILKLPIPTNLCYSLSPSCGVYSHFVFPTLFSFFFFFPEKIWISFSAQLLKTMKEYQLSLVLFALQDNLEIPNTVHDKIYRFKSIITTKNWELPPPPPPDKANK